MFIIDELDSLINPVLYKKLIKKIIFNKNNIQIIHSTHDFDFLQEKEDYRLDQLLFLDKKKGESSLNSISVADIKKNNSVYKQFKQGAFGGIPFQSKPNN